MKRASRAAQVADHLGDLGDGAGAAGEVVGQVRAPGIAAGCMAADGVDSAGRHRVHGDAVLGEFARQRAGEPDHPRLGDRDVHPPGRRRVGRDAAQIDDAAPAGARDMRRGGLRAPECAVESAAHDPAPLLGADLGQRRLPADRGVVDQDVQPPESRTAASTRPRAWVGSAMSARCTAASDPASATSRAVSSQPRASCAR